MSKLKFYYTNKSLIQKQIDYIQSVRAMNCVHQAWFDAELQSITGAGNEIITNYFIYQDRRTEYHSLLFIIRVNEMMRIVRWK